MRIVLIHTHFDYLDGSTRFLLEICKHLKRLGDSVTIICLNMKHFVVSEYAEVEDAIFPINEPPPRSAHFWLRLPFIQAKIKESINKIKPSCVIANIFPCQYLVPELPGITTLWYCHEPSSPLYVRTRVRNLSIKQRTLVKAVKVFLRYYDKRKVGQIDKIACNSDYTADFAQRIYGRRPVVVYPGVDGERFRSVATEKANPKIILSVGKLLRSKRLDLVLQAAHILSRRHQGFRVVIAGDGPEYTSLNSLAETLGVSNLVEFRRYVTEANLVELYSKATVVVYPSLEESFGLVPLEAMSCSTPVVACRTGGPSETIVNGETGFLVDPLNIEQLAQKIDLLLSDLPQVKDMGAHARMHVVRRFTWRRAAQQIHELCALRN